MESEYGIISSSDRLPLKWHFIYTVEHRQNVQSSDWTNIGHLKVWMPVHGVNANLATLSSQVTFLRGETSCTGEFPSQWASKAAFYFILC